MLVVSSNNSSVCDIFKGNSSKIINKLEMQIPTQYQIYSDMYKEYLHVMDDVFGTCIMSEKEFLEKIGINQDLVRNIESYTNFVTEMWLNQIDYYENYLKWYSQMRISGMKTYEKFIHLAMDSYSRSLSNFTRNFEK